MWQIRRYFLFQFLTILLFFILCGFDFAYGQSGQENTASQLESTGSQLLPGISFDFGSQAGFSENIIHLIALLTILSLAPSILIMMTSFTRIIVILSILRTAMGLQQTPPNSVLVSLSLFLTFYVMTPVFVQSYETGIKPLINKEITLQEGIEKAAIPVRDFMMRQVREDDLMLFYNLQDNEPPTSIDQIGMENLVPSFIISELRRAFEIGFLVFVPFIIIDMVVASVLMSMGMMMLPPVIISLPFKLIFFVLVDGWHTVTHSIIYSYN